MGDWNITVRGTGSHHNKNLREDANRMAAKFVADMKAAGHSIKAASFTYGGEDNITDPEAYVKVQIGEIDDTAPTKA